MYKRALLPGIVFLCALYFAKLALVEAWNQSHLSEVHSAKIEGMEIVENEDQLFYPKVSYSFSQNGKEVHAEESLDKRLYKNPYKVEDYFSDLVKSDLFVWCNPKNPQNCTIEKNFPYKNAIYSLILLSISLYFYFLGRVANGPVDIRK